ALYVATLEPHERVAALLAGGAERAPMAAPDPAPNPVLAGTPGGPAVGSERTPERAPEPAPEPAPKSASVIASAPPIDGLELAGLEPDQRVAALQSSAPAQGSAPAPVVAIASAAAESAGAASGSDGAERPPGASAPPQPGAGLGDVPFGPLWQPAAYAPGVAPASDGAIPSLSSSQWQTLTEALRAYGERQEAQAQPIPLRYDSQQ
ncbi:MAG: hypothetical protein V3S87_11360, partial [Alphaproteobacteria bacterium]